VLAAGIARRWPPALGGAIAAVGVLGLAIALFGPLLARVPLSWVRLAAGGLLVYLGATWLRKAILRAAGRKAQRDEAAAFVRERERLAGADVSAFTAAFNGVFAEGIEVVVIVLSFGTGRAGALRAAIGGALAAIVLVTIAGFAVHAPLARVPENLLKWTVAVVLLAFGTLWLGEGAGIAWPLGDAFAIALVALYALGSMGAVAVLRRMSAA